MLPPLLHFFHVRILFAYTLTKYKKAHTINHHQAFNTLFNKMQVVFHSHSVPLCRDQTQLNHSRFLEFSIVFLRDNYHSAIRPHPHQEGSPETRICHAAFLNYHKQLSKQHISWTGSQACLKIQSLQCYHVTVTDLDLKVAVTKGTWPKVVTVKCSEWETVRQLVLCVCVRVCFHCCRYVFITIFFYNLSKHQVKPHIHKNLFDALDSPLQNFPLLDHLCTSEAATDTPKHGFNKLRYISRTWFKIILIFNASASLWQPVEWTFHKS